MLRETGRVVAVDEHSVWVETIRQSTCGACAANKGCGHGILNRYASSKRGLVRVLPGRTLAPSDCSINDQVLIELPEEVILRGSIVVYLLPLLAMLAGASLPGLAGFAGDLPALLGAAAGMAAGLLLVRLHAWHHRDDVRQQPALVEIVRGLSQPLQVH